MKINRKSGLFPATSFRVSVNRYNRRKNSHLKSALEVKDQRVLNDLYEEDQAFTLSYDLAPPPPPTTPIRQLLFPVCRPTSLLTARGGGGSQITGPL
jgi:hypothetical protein